MESKLILFQGDSITDTLRCKTKEHYGYGFVNMGYGYVNLIAAHLGETAPYQYRFLNRGISGNRVVDLYARIKADIINLRPDYLSILIGVNDVWHEYTAMNGVEAEKFELVYGLLLEELLMTLPGLKLMLLEPFVLPGSATRSDDEYPNRWEFFRSETDLRRQEVKRLTHKHGVTFVPLQDLFDTANANAPTPGYWLADGVHPTPDGHELIKQVWLEAFGKIK